MRQLDLNKYSGNKTDDNTIEFVKTDSVQLNEMLGGGIRTGNLIILQAPSGAGKTTFMMRLFIRSLIAGKKVAYISIGEQDETEVFERIACMYCKIDYAKFIDTRKEEEVALIHSFRDKNKDRINIYYSDDPFCSLTDAAGQPYCEMNIILKDIKEKGIKFIFIDYLGAAMAENLDSQYSYLTKLAAKLKNICTNKNIMMFTSMQTNRILKSELRMDNFDPSMVDETFMADSIGPARKASICMSLFDHKGKYYLNVFKNRLNGKLGCLELDFSPLNYEWVEYFGKEGF